MDARQVFFCLISFVFLCSFEVEKSASYFMENKEEAETLLKEKCSKEQVMSRVAT